MRIPTSLNIHSYPGERTSTAITRPLPPFLTPCRKKKAVHKTTSTDDKRLQNTLKRLGVNTIPGIEEVRQPPLLPNLSCGSGRCFAFRVACSGEVEAWRMFYGRGPAFGEEGRGAVLM